jgi:hypothetical protein
LLCGSSRADVTAESDSSWTTRPLMGTHYTIQSNNNNNNYTLQKEIKEKCVSPDTISHQQSETELNPGTNKIPDLNTSMLFANSFHTKDTPKQPRK